MFISQSMEVDYPLSLINLESAVRSLPEAQKQQPIEHKAHIMFLIDFRTHLRFWYSIEYLFFYIQALIMARIQKQPHKLICGYFKFITLLCFYISKIALMFSLVVCTISHTFFLLISMITLSPTFIYVYSSIPNGAPSANSRLLKALS